MIDILRRKTGLRAVTAMVAAYAFALQMLLTGVVATQMAAANPADPFVICTSTGVDGGHGTTGKAVNHLTCAVCSLATSTPTVSGEHAAVVFQIAVPALYTPADAASASGTRRHEPRSSQGPPLNA